MTKKKKRLLSASVAVGLSAVMITSVLLNSIMVVLASDDMMPGIETIVNGKSMKILEITADDSQAELGAYVAGMEPWIRLYKEKVMDAGGDIAYVSKNFSDLEEGLKSLPSENAVLESGQTAADVRKAFAEGTATYEKTGSILPQFRDFTDAASDDHTAAPLKFSEYQEAYFPEHPDEWTKLELDKVQSVEIKGRYEPTADMTGDYTEDEKMYLPVADEDPTQQAMADYKENIYGFNYLDQGVDRPYKLEFEPVGEGEVATGTALDNLYSGSGMETDLGYGYGYYESIYQWVNLRNAEDVAKFQPDTSMYRFKEIDPLGLYTYTREIQLDMSVTEALLTQVWTDGSVPANFDSTSGIFINLTYQDMQDVIMATQLVMDAGGVGGGSDSTEEPDSETETVTESETVTETVTETETETETFSEPVTDAPEAEVYAETFSEPVTDALEAEVYEETFSEPVTYTPETEVYVDIPSEPDSVVPAAEGDVDIPAGTYPDGSIVQNEDGVCQYYIWARNEAGNPILDFENKVVYTKVEMLYEEGKQMVPKNEVVSEAGSGYYSTVDKVTFCCTKNESGDYVFTGDYAGMLSDGDEEFISVTKGEGNFYTTESTYTLTPGKGTHTFVPDEAGTLNTVKITHIYYKGGYENHDWFKRYVLHLDPGDGTGKTTAGTEEAKTAKAQFEKFKITVDTYTKDSLTAEAKELWKNDNSADKPSSFDEGKYIARILEDYQLVSVGGDLSEQQEIGILAGVSKKNLSVIINSDLVSGEEYSGMNQLAGWLTYAESASAYLGLVGGDGKNPSAKEIEKKLDSSAGVDKIKTAPHFVLNNVYFFSGADATGTGVDTTLNQFVSKQLHTVFVDSLTSSGFKEITEYIDVENQLREIENAGKESADEKYSMLEEDISQARAIEYILNFAYKRNLAEKAEINVLDLEPADGTLVDTITSAEIHRWLDETGSSEVEYDNVTLDKRPPFYLTYDFGEIKNFTGVTVKMNRFVKDVIGCSVYVSDDLGTYTSVAKQDLPFRTNPTQTISFTSACSGRYIILDIGSYITSASDITANFFNGPVVNITKMSTSEFAGKIGDLNNQYDMIYLGSDTSNSTYFKNVNDSSGTGLIPGKKYPYYTESVMNGMVYTHVGDVGFRKEAVKLVGLMDTDYFPYPLVDSISKKSQKYLYSTELFKFRSYGTIGADGKTKLYLDGTEKNVDFSRLTSNSLFSAGNESVKKWTADLGNLGVYRESGNDITPVLTNKLIEFAQSGYPVVTEDDIYVVDEDYKNKEPNGAVVDNTSCIYEFLDQVKGLSNVKTKSQLNKDSSSMGFYVNLPKPKLDFGENSIGKPPIYKGIAKGEPEGTVKDYIPNEDKTLRYTFQIKDEAIVSHEQETYNCQLFVDLNTDGNFAADEEVSDIIVQDEYENLILPNAEGKYELKIDTTYKVYRTLPNTYREIINWKLHVSNNQNSYIRCSESGLSKIKQNEKIIVNVLQIMPEGFETWDLTTQDDKKWDEEFIGLLNGVEEFGFNIESITIPEFERRYTEDKNTIFDGILHNVPEGESGEPDMLILGFSDLYQDINNTDGEVDDILKFIQNGKSVLFAHDNVSFINYTKNEINMEGSLSTSGDLLGGINKPFVGYTDVPGYNLSLPDWGYNMNVILRQILGLDRFGITDLEAKSILQANKVLTESTPEWKTVKENAADMAYVAGSKYHANEAGGAERQNMQTYSETQGYNNEMIQAPRSGLTETTFVSQLNEGVITQYPYQLDKKFQVAPTHGQYYQVSLEQDNNKDNESDLVVWYCLSDGAYAYNNNDARNNYYIYSNGNVMYTGVGNRNDIGSPGRYITTMEKKLFINTIVAAYHSAAKQPAVNFIESTDYNSNQKQYEYYSTDINKNIDDNIIKKEQELYFRVFDYNLKKSDDEVERELDLNFYVKTEKGKGELTWNEITGSAGESEESNVKQYSLLPADAYELYGEITADGKVKSGKVYTMKFNDLSRLLRGDYGYQDTRELVVTVSGLSLTYGKEVRLFGSSSIIFRKQQLSDLD